MLEGGTITRKGCGETIMLGVGWFRKVAARYVIAQNHIAARYAKGQGVLQDDAEAAYWYRKAAEQGYAGAQYNLGAMYYNGHGVPQDYIQASKWLILAKADGVETYKALSPLELVMLPAQLAEAQRLANQWWEAHHKQ